MFGSCAVGEYCQAQIPLLRWAVATKLNLPTSAGDLGRGCREWAQSERHHLQPEGCPTMLLFNRLFYGLRDSGTVGWGGGRALSFSNCLRWNQISDKNFLFCFSSELFLHTVTCSLIYCIYFTNNLVTHLCRFVDFCRQNLQICAIWWTTLSGTPVPPLFCACVRCFRGAILQCSQANGNICAQSNEAEEADTLSSSTCTRRELPHCAWMPWQKNLCLEQQNWEQLSASFDNFPWPTPCCHVSYEALESTVISLYLLSLLFAYVSHLCACVISHLRH